MNKEQVERPVEESREDTLFAMVGDLYSRKERSTLMWVWGNALFFLALAALSAVLFFQINQTKWELACATIVFICSVQAIILAKIVFWQTMQRNRIIREIKRLELRIAELAEQGGAAKPQRG